MSRFITFLCLLILFSKTSVGQIKIARINVYFEKNSYTISEKMASKLDNILDSIEVWEVEKIYLHGYTDGDAASDYNLRLSEQRCRSVDMFLTDNAVDSDIIVIKPHGEEISSGELTNELRKARDRRVQIVIGYKEPHANTLEWDTIILVADTCVQDTLLDMGNGVFAKMNVCEYEENRDCFRVWSYGYVKCSSEKISKFKLRMGFKNYGQCKNPYVAFDYYIISCNDSCFKKSVTIYSPTKYFKNSAAVNHFRKDFNYHTKRVKFKGEKYLIFEADCPGFMRCGGSWSCLSCGKKKTSIKIKLKRKITLVGDFYPKMGDKIEKYNINCNKELSNDATTIYPKSIMLDSLVLRYKDSTYVLQNIGLHYLRPSWLRCRKQRFARFGNGEYLLGMDLTKRYYRTKNPRYYKIKPKDLKNLTNPGWKPTIEELMKI